MSKKRKKLHIRATLDRKRRQIVAREEQDDATRDYREGIRPLVVERDKALEEATAQYRSEVEEAGERVVEKRREILRDFEKKQIALVKKLSKKHRLPEGAAVKEGGRAAAGSAAVSR